MSFTPVLTVNEWLRLHPAALSIFTTAGIDTCCSGGLTLAAAAHGAGLTFDELAARLRRGLQPGPALPATAPSCGCERKAG